MGVTVLGIQHNFYPRSPCGERRPGLARLASYVNFYPRSPCGERLWPGRLARPFFLISIHALLAESDAGTHAQWPTQQISIHALLAESDQAQGLKISAHGDFYPRSPCGERLNEDRYGQQFWRISIHALLAESDPSDR